MPESQRPALIENSVQLVLKWKVLAIYSPGLHLGLACCDWHQSGPLQLLVSNGSGDTFLLTHSLLFPVLQLQMLGYDVSWAAFNIVEVMSSSKFTYKVQLKYHN